MQAWHVWNRGSLEDLKGDYSAIKKKWDLLAERTEVGCCDLEKLFNGLEGERLALGDADVSDTCQATALSVLSIAFLLRPHQNILRS
jgi:hypothetical protein